MVKIYVLSLKKKKDTVSINIYFYALYSKEIYTSKVFKKQNVFEPWTLTKWSQINDI